MKILHISHPVNIPVKGYGGTQRVIHSLIRSQVNDGNEVSLMAGYPSIIEGVEDLSFTSGSPYEGRKSIVARVISGYSLKAMLKSRNKSFDIIHTHTSSFDSNFFSVLSKSTMLTTLHCPMTFRMPSPFIDIALTKLLPKKLIL